MKVIGLKLPESHLNITGEFVNMGKYASRHEFTRVAIMRLIEEEIERSIARRCLEHSCCHPSSTCPA